MGYGNDLCYGNDRLRNILHVTAWRLAAACYKNVTCGLSA